MAFFPGVVGYVNTDNLEDILDPDSGEFLEKVNSEKHYGVIGIGKPIYKEKRLEEWKEKGYKTGVLIHPTSYIDPRVEIGEGSSVWPFTFIDGNTKIGKGVMVGVHGIIHYATIGDYTHITMRNTILPKVIIEDKVFLGSGSLILEGVKVGYGSAVGSNVLVSKDVPERTLYLGRKNQRKIPNGVYYPLTNREKSNNI